MNSNSSRFGVRGTESLGGGLNVDLPDRVQRVRGHGRQRWPGNRETFVGLQGGWGTVKIGNFLAPYDDIHPIFGNVPTLATTIMSTASLWAQGAVPKALGGFDARLGNSIRYDSPNFSGLHGQHPGVAADRIRQPQRRWCTRWAASTTTARSAPAWPTSATRTFAPRARSTRPSRSPARYNFGIVRVGGGLRAPRLRHRVGRRPEARPVRRVGDGEPRPGPDVLRLDPRRQRRQGQRGGRHAGRRPGQGWRLRVGSRPSSRTRTRCRSAR